MEWRGVVSWGRDLKVVASLILWPAPIKIGDFQASILRLIEYGAPGVANLCTLYSSL